MLGLAVGHGAGFNALSFPVVDNEKTVVSPELAGVYDYINTGP